jgi:hypothetical protein
LWKEIFSTKKEKEPKRKKWGGLMETDVDMEIRKTGFPHRLAKRLLAFRTSFHRPDGDHNNLTGVGQIR